MNNTTDTTRALSALQAIPAEAQGTDIAATLTRIAEALEKQNKILENLTHVVRGVSQAIETVGSYL